jgi:hypothetical protein
MFEGPVEGAIDGCVEGGGFNELDAGIRRLLPLDNEIFALIAAVGQTIQIPKGHLSNYRSELLKVAQGGQSTRGDVPPPKVNIRPPGCRVARGTSFPRTLPIQGCQTLKLTPTKCVTDLLVTGFVDLCVV